MLREIVNVKLKRIFNKSIATALVNLGSQVYSVEVHKDNPNWIVFKFVEDDLFNKNMTTIMKEIRKKKCLCN